MGTKVKNKELLNAAWLHLDDCPVNHCTACALNTKEHGVCHPECSGIMANSYVKLFAKLQEVSPEVARNWEEEETELYHFVSDEMPPLGLMPEYVYEEKQNQIRINDIERAMARYKKAGMPAPKEWTDELWGRVNRRVNAHRISVNTEATRELLRQTEKQRKILEALSKNIKMTETENGFIVEVERDEDGTEDTV